MSKQYISRKGHNTVMVIVTIDDTDHHGQLDAWEQLDDDSWRGHVVYRRLDPAGFMGNFGGWFATTQIREDDTDYSRSCG